MDKQNLRIQEFMRGATIEYQETNQLSKHYCKWFRTTVWGTSSDENQRDVLEIGLNGSGGWIDITSVRGIEITEDVILDLGFILIKDVGSICTYYRDDIGYVKLSTYGLEPIYRNAKPIKYLHNFQRIFFDYLNKELHPKVSKPPKEEKKLTFEIVKPRTAEQILSEINVIKSRSNFDTGDIDFDFDITPSSASSSFDIKIPEEKKIEKKQESRPFEDFDF